MNRLWNIRPLDPQPGPPQWVPVLGQLQRTLQKGEYLPLCPLPMFESNFVQVTSRGAPVHVHHKSNHLTMGVAASLPGPVLPDLLLIARPSKARDRSNLVLTRMVPLELVHLYVHSLSAWRLKLCLVTGRYYYLELNAPDSEVAFLFDRWIRLVHLLQEPAIFWAPRTLQTPLSDLAQMAPPASTWTLQNQPHCRRSAVIVDPSFCYKMLTSQKQRKAKTLQRTLRSQAVGDSVPLIWSQLEQPGSRKKATEKKSHPELGLHSSQTKIQVSGKPSITIRTIFSIVSSTINHKLSSSKGHSESDGAVVLGSLGKTPSYCISENSPDISLLVSYDHVDMRQNMENLSDLDSSTLSSDSLGQDSFYLPAPYSSVPKHKKARRPPSQKTPSVPPTSWKDPFILDQAQKASAVPAPSRKSPTELSAPQKTPAIPGSSRKTPCVLAIPQKAPAISPLSWKTPLVSGIPPKAMPCPVPNQQSLFLSSPSPKALTSPAQDQMTPDPADLGSLPRGRQVENVLERSQPEGKTEPLVLVSTQETQVAEMWAQKMSLELPFHTTQKETKGAVINKAQEITLDGSKGKGKAEDKAHGTMEGRSLDLPGFKPRVMGRQQKWIKTRELAVGGRPQERRRPFSVKELTFAKMVILANSKEVPLRPELVGLPSWLLTPQVSARSTVGLEPLNPIQATELEGTPGVDREAEKLLSDQRQSFKVLPRSKRGPSSPKMERVSQVPIPLPATRWEHVQSPILLNSIPNMEVRVSQKPSREFQETMGMPGPCPLATTESSLKVLVPKLLEIENKRVSVNKVEKTKKKLSIFTPWPRPQVPCPSAVGSRVLNRPGGAGRGWGSSLSGRDQSYLYIYISRGGRWAWGEPAGWPSFAEIKSLSLRLGKSRAWVPVCANERGPGDAEWGWRGEGAGGGGVHVHRRLESQTGSCSAAALIGWSSRVPANKAEGSWFSSVETLETQKRRAPRTEPQAEGRADISLELLTRCMLDKKPSKGPWPTPPFDPRFPNQNQTRNCYQNFLDYHRCMKKMNRRGKSAQPCEYFFHVFRSLCPISWVERWTEQIKSGTFPGKI